MTRRLLISAALLLAALSGSAVDNNTVVIVYNGSSATVTIADNIKSYITNNSNGSHVNLIQSSSFTGNSTGEIVYNLSGSSDDGQFYMEGSYKASLVLAGLDLTNASGAAIDIQNGKRINVSIQNGTVNSLTDCANGSQKGCFVCKGHAEFKGRGSLTVNGRTSHAIWANEYVEVKNCAISIPNAAKDGINCNQYFLMESGSVNIVSPADDGIQVSYKDTPQTEAEDTGNFTMKDGTLSITGHGGVCIKTDGYIAYNGGTQNFNTSDVIEHASTGIIGITTADDDGTEAAYDLSGRRLPDGMQPRGIVILKGKQKSRKVIRR